jgi:hypothetical protein
MARFADIDDVDLLVTGASAPPELLTQFGDLGVSTIVAR